MIDLIVEFIFEFIFEIVLGNDFSEDTKKRIPLSIRILLSIVVLAIYIGAIVLVTIGVVNTFNSGRYKLHAFLAVLDLLLVTGLVYLVVRKIKNRR